MPRATAGIDVDKGSSHEAAGYDPAADCVVGRVSFPVSRAGFEQFRSFLQRLAPEPADALVGLEATGHYHVTLMEFLTEHGYRVVLITPYQAVQVGCSPSDKVKTDRIDARALARFLTVNATTSTPPARRDVAGAALPRHDQYEPRAAGSRSDRRVNRRGGPRGGGPAGLRRQPRAGGGRSDRRSD